MGIVEALLMMTGSTFLTFSQFKDGEQAVEGLLTPGLLLCNSHLMPGFAPGDEFEQTISLVKNSRRRRASSSVSTFSNLRTKVGSFCFIKLKF